MDKPSPHYRSGRVKENPEQNKDVLIPIYTEQAKFVDTKTPFRLEIKLEY